MNNKPQEKQSILPYPSDKPTQMRSFMKGYNNYLDLIVVGIYRLSDHGRDFESWNSDESMSGVSYAWELEKITRQNRKPN